MLQLRDLMTTDVVTVSPDASLREAMELFATHHVSGAPVVVGERVVGVVSTTDLIEFAATEPKARRESDDAPEWKDDSDTRVDREGDDETAARYFIELWAFADAEVGERIADSEPVDRDVLAEHTVGEVMTRAVCALPPTADVSAAADYMRTANVHRVLVMEGDRLVGIVSALDLTKAIADHRIGHRTYVFGRAEHPQGRVLGES